MIAVLQFHASHGKRFGFMDHIVTTIIPIFSFVILGTIARSKGFLFPEFLELADRPGYYLAKPVVVSVTTLFSAFTFSFWLSLG